MRLYCRSEERAHKERGIVERFSRRFEQGLTRLSEGLSRPRTHKGIEKVRERRRLKEQSRGVAQHYTIEVLTDESGRKATALTWKRQPRQGSMATHPGVYCLRSNRPTGTRRACGAPTPLSPTWKRCFAPWSELGQPVPDRHRPINWCRSPQTPQAAGRLLQLDHAAAHPSSGSRSSGVAMGGPCTDARPRGPGSEGHLRRPGRPDDRLIPPPIAGFNAFVVPLARFSLCNLLIINAHPEAMLKMG